MSFDTVANASGSFRANMGDTQTTSCPTSAELADFVRGAAPSVRLEEIAAHLEYCPTCIAALEQAAAHDTNTGSDTLPIDAPRPSELAAMLQEPEYAKMMAAAKALPEAPRNWSASLGARPLPPSLGQYELLERIGAGGMGAVYKARHKRLDRIVALKIIAEHRVADAQALERFVREWVALAKFKNEHIVGAIDACEDQGFHFLVMEYVEGIDLAALVRRGGRLSVPDACEAIRQAALGLEYVAKHGMVHRDIKPSNLMLAADGTVKILDLGLVLAQQNDAASSGLTSDRQILGTVDFMAPEQALDSHAVDIRGDIYSLGCTLYYLLSGEAPFGSEGYSSTVKKLLAHSQAPRPAISKLCPNVSPRLDALVRQMMAKSPSDRPATAGNVASELAAFTTGSDLRALAAGPAGANTSGAGRFKATGRQRFLRRCRTIVESSTHGLRRALPKNVALVALLAVIAAGAYPTWRAVFPPAANHPSRIHYSVPVLDTDKEAAGAWQDLLDSAPKEFWRRGLVGLGDWWMQDADTSQVRFQSTQALSLQFGSTTEPNYELMITLSTNWSSGKTGLFFGGQFVEDGTPKFQAVYIEIQHAGATGVTEATIGRQLESGHDVTQGLASEPLHRTIAGSHSLRIVVRNSTLAAVWFDDVACPGLLTRAPASGTAIEAPPEYSVGAFGFYVNGASGTVLDARFRILKGATH
jgi:tRNA A-37 threonylcarbamoyl transferase component Bud32